MKIQKSRIIADIQGDYVSIRFLGVAMREVAEAQRAVQEIENVAYNHDLKVVIINFGGLVHLSSVFLGRLIQLQKSLKQLGMELRACGMSSDIEKAFKICKLEKLIPAFATEEEAIKG